MLARRATSRILAGQSGLSATRAIRKADYSTKNIPQKKHDNNLMVID
jgi:hypothetical protein